MTLLIVMNLGTAWGAIAGPTFNPSMVQNANQYISQKAGSPVTK